MRVLVHRLFSSLSAYDSFILPCDFLIAIASVAMFYAICVFTFCCYGLPNFNVRFISHSDITIYFNLLL